jgi:putative ABC transport system permease protein
MLVWRLARRELRAGFGGFRVVLACLIVGVAAIAAVGSVNQALLEGLRADARLLLGGDVDVRLTHREATPAEAAWLEANAARLSRVVEMRAMARPVDADGGRALVELKAVDDAYPLVGAVTLDPPLALADALARRDGVAGAVVDRSLLARLGIAIGDRLRIGGATVEVRATVAREPDRVASIAAFGPRLMVATHVLPETGLVVRGSLIRHHTRVLLPPGSDARAWMAALSRALPEAGWQVRDVTGAAPEIKRVVQRMTLFLTFVGLSALLVGGIGVGNGVRAYLDGKVATIATLKCLGASGGLVFAVYMTQVLLLAAIGVALGVVAGAVLPMAALTLAGDILPIRAEPALYGRPLLIAAAFGGLTALTFAIWPVARARAVPAARLFRDTVSPVRGRPPLPYLVATVIAAAALAGLTIWASPDRTLAAVFVAGAVAALLMLRGGAAAVMALAARLPRPRRPAWRLAVANLHRPAAPTPTVMVSLGIGVAVLVAIALIEGALSAQLRQRMPDTAPAFFFIDIQDHQALAFDAAVAGIQGVRELRRVPSLRGRITGIDGVPVAEAAIDPDVRWAVNGDRGITTAATQPDDVDLVAGAWWPADHAGPPLVSLDAGIARGFGVGVGDTLTVNVLGRPLTVRIASLRDIDWQGVPFAFTLILDPRALAGAPMTHIAAVFADAAAEDAIEAAVAAQFPNVTTVRVRDALEAVNGIVETVGDGIRGAALIAVIAGIIVLAGAMAADQRRRTYDAVVFKVLGATRGDLVRLFVIEYGVLGLITGLVAAVIGAAAAWGVTTHLLGLDWVFLPGAAALTVIIAMILTQIVGFAGTWRTLGQKPAAWLRND